MKKVIKKVKLKASYKKDTPEKERHFTILLEDLDSKFDLVIEGHSGLSKQLDDFKIETGKNFKDVYMYIGGLNTKIGGLDTKIGGLNTKIGGLGTEIKRIDTKSDNFRLETEANFKTVFKYLSQIDIELKDIKSEIVDLKKRLTNKADLERFSAIELRIQKIEDNMARSK